MHPSAAPLVLLAATSPALLQRRLRAAGLLSSSTNLPESSLSFSTCELRSTFERDLGDASPTTRSSAAPAERDPGTHPFEVWVTDDADTTPAAHTRTFSNCLKGATVAATPE